MHTEWLDLRRELLFTTAPAAFVDACDACCRELDRRHRGADPADRERLAEIAAALCLDLHSYLPAWRLATLDDGDLAAGAARFRSLLGTWGAAAAAAAMATEEALLRRSSFLRLSRLADAGRISTRWGYDYAHGVAPAMRRGALLVTTNPPLVNFARKERPERWTPVRDALRREYGALPADGLTALFCAQVVLENCRILRPIFEASGGRYGYVNLQVNPHDADDADAMAAQIEWLHDVLAAALGGHPNVVFKVPGTRAALDTVRRVTAQGIGVTVTLGFAVDQHVAFAEAIDAGCAPVSFLVMMSGRLDDPVGEELAAAGVADPAIAARWASTAVIRQTYDLVYRRCGTRKSALLVASLRGPWNVDAAIADGPAPVFITAFPDKTEEYDAEPRDVVCRMGEPVPPEVEARLRRSRLYCQAVDPGALGVAGFDGYAPVAATGKAFAAAWDEVRAWLQG